jgi:hypothetical protein
MSTLTFPRETIEFLPITVTIDGVAVLTGVSFAKTTGAARPTTWVAAYSLDGKIGILLSGETAGTYHVYAKIVDAPETPVIECGSYIIR